MANSIQFDKVKNLNGITNLYQATGQANQFFYWVNSKVSGTLGTLPDNISLSDSWQEYNGTYIFTVSAIDASDNTVWSDFCTKVRDKVKTLVKASAQAVTYPITDPYKAIVWLQDVVNPDAKAPNPKVTVSDGECLFLLLDGEWYVTTEEKHVGFGNLKVPLDNSMKVIPAKDRNTFSPGETDFQGLVLTFWDLFPLTADPTIHAEHQWYISLMADDCGTLQGQLALRNLNEEGFRDWAPGFRYQVPLNTNNPNAEKYSQFYPLLQDGATEFVVYNLQWKPFDTIRTSAYFSDRAFVMNDTGTVPQYKLDWPDATSKNPENLFAFAYDLMAFRSCYKTVYDNKKVLLIPHESARMVIGSYTDVAGNERYYFMPDGDFEIGIETSLPYTAGDPVKLLCGLAGTEFINVTPRYEAQQGDLLSFKANTKTDTTTNITSYVSSYAGVYKNPVNTVNPIYFAQPKAASLFKLESSHNTFEHPILSATDVQNSVLDQSQANTIFFPMVPYGNVILTEGEVNNTNIKLNWQDLTNYELIHLSKQRKSLISAQLSNTSEIEADVLGVETITPTKTATPQGFIAEYSSGGLKWNSVTLAKSEAPHNFEFLPKSPATNIPNRLRDALQSNQLFMVATSQTAHNGDQNILGKINSEVTIEGWPFEAVVPQTVSGADYNNVLIFKFSHGTLKDLVLDHTNWNHGEYFNNNNAAQVSGWIYDYISKAELEVQQTNSGGNAQASWLQNFVEIVNNPGWNGVLMLKVDVSVQNFPKELEGLIAGINLKQFYGHHIGFNINKLDHDPTNGLEIQSSSIFGLINYVATDTTNTSVSQQSTTNSKDPVYAFEVLNLQVLFENSAIKHFASKIQLTTNSWFDEKAVVNKSSGIQGFNIHAIEMYGHLEHHNGKDIYTFITKPNEVYQFQMQSKVLNYVEITQAKFTTLHITDPQTNGNTSTKEIYTQFSFSGFMNFIPQTPFDVFSFGNTTDNTPNGLAFNTLAVDMDFKLSTNTTTDLSTVDDKTFTFDPSTIAFDISTSTPREESMYSKFPLTLSNLAYAKNQSDKPSNHGYLAISVNTDKKFSALGENWYGLEYNLNLGTPGALAAKMDFTASIITAWSPGGNQLQMDVGIKFPGSGGAKKLLSLESVIKLSIGQILFDAVKQDDQSQKMAYILTFFNIGLKFFSIHLPLSGAFSAALFGDPDQTNNSGSSLGWYAAYDNMDNKKLKKKTV